MVTHTWNSMGGWIHVHVNDRTRGSMCYESINRPFVPPVYPRPPCCCVPSGRGKAVEAVIIPMVRGPDQRPRYTLCVSSQSGTYVHVYLLVYGRRVRAEDWTLFLTQFPSYTYTLPFPPPKAAPWHASSATQGKWACWGASRPVRVLTS